MKKKKKSDSDRCKHESVLKKQHIKECEECRSNIYDGYDPILDIFEIGRPIIFKNDTERSKHKEELKKAFIENLIN